MTAVCITSVPTVSRRAFLQATAAAAAGMQLEPARAAVAVDDAVDLAMTEVASTDASVPGTWYILDRTKPVRKFVDRKSLFPVGPRSLVLTEQAAQYTFYRKPTDVFWVVALPADLGEEQTFLGCLPSFRPPNGGPLKYDVVFHQGKGPGTRVAQFSVMDCPTDVPITFSLKCILLNPPILTDAQKAATTQALQKRAGKPKDWSKQPGFPEPDFTDGGPKFVNAPVAASYGQTVYNVLKQTNTLVPHSGSDLKYFTLDPEVAMNNKQGNCSARARVAAKGLVGVARACYAGIAYEGGSTSHALLVIEDPETGAYFLGDVAIPNPVFYPHFGNLYVTGGAKNEGIPNPYKLPTDFAGEITSRFSSKPSSLKAYTRYNLIGSSNSGFFKDFAQYQEWLKKAPGEFRDLQKTLLKK